MFKHDDRAYLKDIIIACGNILSYKEGFDFNKFLKDGKTQDAVVRNIEIIGEAVKNISEELKEKYPEIEWRGIAKTRDKLIHAYFGIDLDIIWDIINVDIPQLKNQIEEVLHKETGE